MVAGIYLLMEILAIIVCLFWLCGERIRVTRKMLCLIAAHIGLFVLCDYIGFDSFFQLLIYAIIIGYTAIEFRISLYQALVKFITMILMCSGIQIIITILCELLSHGTIDVERRNLYTNFLLFFLVYFLYKKIKVHAIVGYIKDENKTSTILFTGIFAATTAYILYSKKSTTLNGIDYLLYFGMAIIIIFLIGSWEKARIQIKEKKIEVEAHEIYAESYQKLIGEIRVRQHEFDNHLQTIINQQYTCNTYEELVHVQSEYMHAITFDNRYNKLLRQGNSVYIGFLYGKFVSMEEQGISVDYKINIGQLKCGMPVYKIIEITSDLLNNAREALTFPTDSPQPVYYQIDETEEEIILEIRNVGEPLSPDFIGECFKKDFSKKGIGRGLGLYNVKRITDQYGAEIEFQNIMVNHRNWISFTVTIPKPIYP